MKSGLKVEVFDDSSVLVSILAAVFEVFWFIYSDGSVIVFYRYAESKGAAVKGSDPE